MKSKVMGLALMLCMAMTPSLGAQEVVPLNIRGVMERPAVLYLAEKAVSGAVLVPQSGLKADSWEPLALQLNIQNISALALNFTSVEDVSAGVEFLIAAGIEDITLMGGSVGGASILKLINKNKHPQVKRAVFLGTGEGNSGDSENVRKLFIVAENDMFAGQTYASFRKASEPKEMIIFSGSQHGQELFNGPQRDRLERHILSFLNTPLGQ